AHLLIHHGRRVCIARKPRCGICPVRDLCPSAPYFLSGKTPPWERPAVKEKRVEKKSVKKVVKKKRVKERVAAKKAKRR
ncbi:MAG TPA: hypothetical protein VN539_05745, partial [Candidatus Saccharimonadales bacterium]|nr:hypothetical protein [Candidatus Saccharimonadales bacterium]